MSHDDRLALVVIFFVVVLPLLCLEVGRWIGGRRVRKAWQKAIDENKPVPYRPLEQTGPKPIPTDTGQLLSDYEDAIYFMARHAEVTGGMTQGEINAFQADQTRLYADVVRLRTAVLEGLGVTSTAETGTTTQ
jgi:hypothetical protein